LRLRTLAVLSLAVVAAASLPVPGASGATPPDRYVSTAGSDGNPGTLAAPWRTLQHAADAAGRVVRIRGGTYAGFTLRRDGLTFVAYDGEQVVVSGGVDVIRIDGVAGATIRGLTVRGAQGPKGSGILVASSQGVAIEDSVLRDNRSYGIRTWNSTSVRIRRNEITRNDEGIRVSYTADGVRIVDNDIHHNDSMIEPDSPDKGGGVGVVFLKSTGAVLAKGNRLWANRAPDRFHGYDGGGFEIFGASDVTIVQNVLWDNKHVMETGTADGIPCARNTFSRNVAYAASSVPGYARGLLFACMSDSEVANNVLHGFDQELIAVVRSPGYAFQGSLDRLRIRNNLLISEGANLYYFQDVPASVTIDRNLIWNRKNDAMAYVVGVGAIRGYASLRSRLGFERNGVSGDPRVVDLAGRDYHLRASSPAIDRGIVISGLTSSYRGSAPDIGRYEAR
jgi:parallel beta-helix repeat protein